MGTGDSKTPRSAGQLGSQRGKAGGVSRQQIESIQSLCFSENRLMDPTRPPPRVLGGAEKVPASWLLFLPSSLQERRDHRICLSKVYWAFKSLLLCQPACEGPILTSPTLSDPQQQPVHQLIFQVVL